MDNPPEDYSMNNEKLVKVKGSGGYNDGCGGGGKGKSLDH
jgi:hypothetical protein